MPVMYSLAGKHEAFVIVIFGSQDATTDVLSTDIVVNQEVSCIAPAVSSPDIDREKRVKQTNEGAGRCAEAHRTRAPSIHLGHIDQTAFSDATPSNPCFSWMLARGNHPRSSCTCVVLNLAESPTLLQNEL